MKTLTSDLTEYINLLSFVQSADLSKLVDVNKLSTGKESDGKVNSVLAVSSYNVPRTLGNSDEVYLLFGYHRIKDIKWFRRCDGTGDACKRFLVSSVRVTLVITLHFSKGEKSTKEDSGELGSVSRESVCSELWTPFGNRNLCTSVYTCCWELSANNSDKTLRAYCMVELVIHL